MRRCVGDYITIALICLWAFTLGVVIVLVGILL
jgi:hypothetical protein